MRLLIISHTAHYYQNGSYRGWGPTVLEIDHLAKLFDEIVHIAPVYQSPAPASSLPYTAGNISLRLVHPAGGDSVLDKASVLACYPDYTRQIKNQLKKTDAVHVRCPANISLLALFMLSLSKYPDYRWVKYAGNWRPETKEPLSYSLQRYCLEKNLHHGSVSVNGHWEPQPAHVFPFPNPCLTEVDINRGQTAAAQKKLKEPVNLLFVGRLEVAKGALRVIEIASQLKQMGVNFRADMVGDSPQRQRAENLRYIKKLDNEVYFHGWLPKPALADFYAKAHIFLLPSTASEGWPKVLSEAMAYGAVPLAGSVSTIPQILSRTGAGLAISASDITGYRNAILQYLNSPTSWEQASAAGVKAASSYTYEHYLGLVQDMFMKMWGIRL